MSEKDCDQSFYSISGSKSDFTFIEEPKTDKNTGMPISNSNIRLKFDIRESSAVELSDDPLNKSINSIHPQMNVNDISQIDYKNMNQMECSMCLQKEIDCLSLPNNPSLEELKEVKQKMDKLKHDQSVLQKQIQIFQGLMTATKFNNQNISKQLYQNFINNKECQHRLQNSQPFNIPWPDPNQITIRTIQESVSSKQQTQSIKHYDIKPNKQKSVQQQQLNQIYKKASFTGQIILLDDHQNKFRIQVNYYKEQILIELINYQEGQTNFVYAIKLNEQIQGNQKISEKIVYPMHRYRPKKFTVSLNVVLLIFEQHSPKEEKYLIQMQDIRTISMPLPINYFIDSRFSHFDAQQSFLTKIQKRLYIYEIDINYNIDQIAYKTLQQSQWIKKHWITLRGSNSLLKVELRPLISNQTENRIVFRIGTKQKDAQQAIDLIQYLCFMFSH